MSMRPGPGAAAARLNLQAPVPALLARACSLPRSAGYGIRSRPRSAGHGVRSPSRSAGHGQCEFVHSTTHSGSLTQTPMIFLPHASGLT